MPGRSQLIILKLNTGMKKSYAYRLYKEHERNARSRKIDFLFSYEEWHDFWSLDNRLANRGREKNQFVMARDGDSGPYAAWNVHLATADENRRETKFKGRKSTSGYKGVTRSSDGKKWVGQLSGVIGGKSIYCGTHNTPEQALAAVQQEAIRHHQMSFMADSY